MEPFTWKASTGQSAAQKGQSQLKAGHFLPTLISLCPQTCHCLQTVPEVMTVPAACAGTPTYLLPRLWTPSTLWPSVPKSLRLSLVILEAQSNSIRRRDSCQRLCSREICLPTTQVTKSPKPSASRLRSTCLSRTEWRSSKPTESS